jgi:uncharacterized C2H2 Zn-finger protein
MPDRVKEKLVELLDDALLSVDWDSQDYPDTEKATDILIANGVTVQEPQKPIEHKVDVTAIVVGNASWGKGTTLYKCPKCGNFISRLYDYCFKCGQAFDWSELPKPPKGE